MADVPATSLQLRLKAARGSAMVKKIDSFPTDGAAPKVTAYNGNDGRTLADFYRNGAYDVHGDRIYPQKSIAPIIQSPASIRVYGTKITKKDGKTEKTPDYDFIPPYTKFILESVQESRQERSQIIETFGDFYVFFFGERPPIFNYTGTLINSQNINWVQEFNYYYDQFLRGTKCVDKNARIVLTYGNVQVEGFILGFGSNMDAIMEHGVKVNFSVVITKRTDSQYSDDFGLTENAKQREAAFQAFLNEIAGKAGSGMSQAGTSEAYNGLTSTLRGGPATFAVPV